MSRSSSHFTWHSRVHSVDNDGTLFYLRTNKDAPKYKVVTLDIGKPTELKEFIPETDGTLSDIGSVNRGANFAVVYKRNVGGLTDRPALD